MGTVSDRVCRAVAGVLFIRLTLRKTSWLPFLFSGVIGIFSAFAILSLISSLWSVNAPWTLYKSFECLTDIALVAAIVATLDSVEDYRKLINWSWILMGLLVASAWAGAVIDPSDALFSDPSLRFTPLSMRLVELMPSVSCNDLSEASAILALVALCRLWLDPDSQRKKNWYRALFVAGVMTMVITQTRGALAAFVVGVMILLLFARRYLLFAVGGIGCGYCWGHVASVHPCRNQGPGVPAQGTDRR